MLRMSWRTWLAAGVCAAGVLSCEKAPVNKHLRDPLLISKKPVEGKPDKAGPLAVAHEEPTAPSLPATALATAPSERDAPGRAASKPPVPATPAGRPSLQPNVTAEPAVRRREAGNLIEKKE